MNITQGGQTQHFSSRKMLSLHLMEEIGSAATEEEFIARLVEAQKLLPLMAKVGMSRCESALKWCDRVLERATTRVGDGSMMAVDVDPVLANRTSLVLLFSSHLFGCTYSRSIYPSAERVIKLLSSGNMETVVNTLRLLATIGQRSHFLTATLPENLRKQLAAQIIGLTQFWNGRVREVSMLDCLETNASSSFLLPMTWRTARCSITVRSVEMEKSFADELDHWLKSDSAASLTEEERLGFAARLRYVRALLSDERRSCVMARLIATEVLLYSRTLFDDEKVNSVVTDRFIDETVAILKLVSTCDADDVIRSEALRTLMSIVSIEGRIKFTVVLNAEGLGAQSPHGYLADMVRTCAADVLAGKVGQTGATSLQFCNALFSFLTRFAAFSNGDLARGSETLLACGLMDVFVGLVQSESLSLKEVPFVARAVRILDQMLSARAANLTNANELAIVAQRFAFEVKESEKEANEESVITDVCIPQRAALMKSILLLMRRAMHNVVGNFSQILDDVFLGAVVEVISRAEYFGGSLFHTAVSLITTIVLLDPMFLTAMQEKGVTDAILRSIFHFEFPYSRGAIALLPNVFSILCMNEDGLQKFTDEKPFEQFFRIILSVRFISLDKRHHFETNDIPVLGTSLADFLRSRPTLQTQFFDALVGALDRLILLRHGTARCVMGLEGFEGNGTNSNAADLSAISDPMNDDEEAALVDNEFSDDDVEPASTHREMGITFGSSHLGVKESMEIDETMVVPLGVYLNIMVCLVEAVVARNASVDFAMSFIECGALDRFVKLFYQPQIPTEILPSTFVSLTATTVRMIFQTTRVDTAFDVVTAELRTHCEKLVNISDSELSVGEVSETKLGKNDESLAIVNAVCALCGVLTTVLKSSFSNATAQLRTTMMSFWANRGAERLSMMFSAYRVLSWELAIAKKERFLYSMKESTGSQTDFRELSNSRTGEALLGSAFVLSENVIPQPTRSLIPKNSWIRSKSGWDSLCRSVKQFDDLFVVLAKVCIGSIPRNRRTADVGGVLLCEFMLEMAANIFRGFNTVADLQLEAADLGVSLEFATHWVDALKNEVFEEAAHPHHALLSAFYYSGCHNTFFSFVEKLFSRSALIYDTRARRFLKSWLELGERLVNSHALLHSHFRFNVRVSETFPFPVQNYLTLCQRDVLQALAKIMQIMDSKWVSPTTCTVVYEAMLPVFKGLVNGLVHQFAETEGYSDEERIAEMRIMLASKLDEGAITQLVDMGFERHRAVEALLDFSTVGEAAGYLVSNDGFPPGQPQYPDAQDVAAAFAAASDVTMGEGEFALRLLYSTEDALTKLKNVSDVDCKQFFNVTLIDVLNRSVKLLDQGELMVYGVSELLRSVFNEIPKFPPIICVARLYLVDEVIDLTHKIMDTSTSEEATRNLAKRVHLSCLLWSSVVDIVADTSHRHNSLHQVLVSTLEFVSNKCGSMRHLFSLIAPLCLWIELYDKTLHQMNVKERMEKLVEKLVWKYRASDRAPAGMWTEYPMGVSLVLTNAYRDGKDGATVKIGNRLSYYVDFTTMTQRTSESLNDIVVNVEGRLKKGADVLDLLQPGGVLVDWNNVVCDVLVPTLVSLFTLPNVDNDTIHAALVLAVRVTRNANAADSMRKSNGISTILNIEGKAHSSSASLFALLVRQCVDDDHSISQLFERTIRTLAAGGYNSTAAARFFHNGRGAVSRDWHLTMRTLAPLCARNPRLFIETMKRVARRQKGLLVVVPINSSECTPRSSSSNNQLDQIVNMVMASTLSMKGTSSYVISKAARVRLLTELVKSYSPVANLVAETSKVNGGDQLALVSLLDECIVRDTPTEGTEVPAATTSFTPATYELSAAVKELVSAIASCNHSPKAQESLVTSIVASLHLAFCEATSRNLEEKVKLLATLTVVARDSCSSSSHEAQVVLGAPVPANAIVRLLIKKRVFDEFVKACWHLDLSSKGGIDTMNHILRVLEEITRSVNSAPRVRINDNPSAPPDVRASADVPQPSIVIRAPDVIPEEHLTHPVTVLTPTDVDMGAQSVNGHSTPISHSTFVNDLTFTFSDRMDDDTTQEDYARARQHHDSSESSSESSEINDDDRAPQGSNEMEVDRATVEDDRATVEDDRATVEDDDPEGTDEDDEDEEDDEDDDGEEELSSAAEETQEGPFAQLLREERANEAALNQTFYLDDIENLDANVHFPHSGLVQIGGRSLGTVETVHPLLQTRPTLFPQAAVVPRDWRNYRSIPPHRRIPVIDGRGGAALLPELQRMSMVRRLAQLQQYDDMLDRFGGEPTMGHAVVGDLFQPFAALPATTIFNVLDRSAPEGRMGEWLNFIAKSTLERFMDAARLMGDHPFDFTWIIAVEHITNTLVLIEKKEREEKKQQDALKKAEEEKKKQDASKEEPPAEQSAPPSNASVAAQRNLVGLSNAGGTALDEPMHAADIQIADGEPTSEERTGGMPTEGVPSGMVNSLTDDSTQADAVGDAFVIAGIEPEEPESSLDSSSLSLHTAPSSLSGDTEENDLQSSVTQEEEEETAEEATPAAVSQQASTVNYREILGDIEIPEGVDPAVLAELPEDIRAEVIRDHLRQQNMRNAARGTQGGAGAAAGTSSGAAASGAVGVDQLDPEFLEALPAELRAEVVAEHRRAVAGPSTTTSQSLNGAQEAAAFFDSLSPGLRAEVLAEADDAVLQVLPQNVAAEARRLRANYAHEVAHVMRFLAPTRHRGLREVRVVEAPPFGALAGATTLASKNVPQILDQDAIVTLVILFLVNSNEASTQRLLVNVGAQRLQKFIKSICAHSATCDFVIWCLIALLDSLTVSVFAEPCLEFPVFSNCFISNICVTSGPEIGERIIKFRDPQSVVIHQSVKANVTRLVLETLISIAKSYPGHFLPLKLRSAERATSSGRAASLSHFWRIVASLSKSNPLLKEFQSQKRHLVSGVEGANATNACGAVHSGRAANVLEESALGLLMVHLNRAVILGSPPLQDKLLRLISTVMQTLPNDTSSKLNLDETCTLPPLWPQFEAAVEILTEGECSEEGIADGRLLLAEGLRALPSSMAVQLRKRFITTAEQLAARLVVELSDLRNELGTICHQEGSSTASSSAAQAEQPETRFGRVLTDRYDSSAVVIEGTANSRAVIDASNCAALQLPATKKLMEKRGLQYSLLRTLRIFAWLSDSLKKGIERMSVMLGSLNSLWETLSECLSLLAREDVSAALALQPAAEAFFLVHSSSTTTQLDSAKLLEDPDILKLVLFAEKHRTILNQVLRQGECKLSEGPFSVLVQIPKILDFDVKRKFFRKQIRRFGVGGPEMALRVRRSHLFTDSYRELFRLRTEDWKSRFYVIFDGEEGQDAGGLLREWFSVITREIFNPNYALFIAAPGDRATYMINKMSYVNPEHLDYFRFVGRIIGKALYDDRVLDCYFTRAFYKHILSVSVKAQDLESEDPGFYKSLEYLLTHPIEEMGTELTFSLEVEEFGVRKMRELKENGASIVVNDDNKEEYVKLVCQMKMTGSIEQQLAAFLEGFYEIIPKSLISVFSEQELELLISGLPNIDVEDLFANTDYRHYTRTSPQIQWFWKAVRSFGQEDRAKLIQFATGTSKVPLLGFAALEGMNGPQKFSICMDSRSADRLPAAHTCFNQLDLPLYDSYEKLRSMLLLAIRECTEGFGFA